MFKIAWPGSLLWDAGYGRQLLKNLASVCKINPTCSNHGEDQVRTFGREGTGLCIELSWNGCKLCCLLCQGPGVTKFLL